MLTLLKCRGESDLGLCISSGHAKRRLLRSGDFRFLNVFGRKIRRRILVNPIKVCRCRGCRFVGVGQELVVGSVGISL